MAIHSDWKGEVVVRETPGSIASVSPGRGYMIRLKNCPGAVFTIDESSFITIGQSSRMGYTFDEWALLQQEIKLGINYMARVIMANTYGKKPETAVTIKAKDYKNGCLYRDYKGRYILYIGKAQLIVDRTNRERSNYLYAIVEGSINNINLQVKNMALYITGQDIYVRVDSYVGKPQKLVECIWTPPAPYTALCTSTDRCSWRYL